MSSAYTKMELRLNFVEHGIRCIFSKRFQLWKTPMQYKFVLTHCEIILCSIGLKISHFSPVGEVLYLLLTAVLHTCIADGK